MRSRDRYIDLLGALALIAVVASDMFGWTGLTLFPAMGILFAIGGTLATSALDRAATARAFWGERLRRFLVPFWVSAAAFLVAMVVTGWTAGTETAGTEITARNAWLWVLPLADPPVSDAGANWVMPLWFIRTYLWFLLLSPALLWLFRRWPIRTIAVPLVQLPLMALGLLDVTEPYRTVVVSMCAYGVCWMLGFAHHDGKLQNLPKGVTALVGLAAMDVGLWFAISEQDVYGTWSLEANPMAGMLYSSGAVLVLLRLYARMRWLERLSALDALFSVMNRWALTIFLWANVATFLAPDVLSRTPLAEFNTADPRGSALRFLTTWLLIAVVVVLVGWVEDVAAGRRLRLAVWRRGTSVPVRSEQSVPTAETASPAPVPVGADRSGAMHGSRVEGNTAAPDGEPPKELGDLGIDDASPESVGAPAGRSAAVQANFVVDAVTPEEVAALRGVRAGPEDVEFADPDPGPITEHLDEPSAQPVSGGSRASPHAQ